MNQILSTKIEEDKPSSNKFNKKVFKFQFAISIFLTVLLSSGLGYFYYSIRTKEKVSDRLINNYNITKLYANDSLKAENTNTNNLFGIIEIPKLNIYYPVFSTLTDEQLKTSPCKFYGGSLNENGNICIAGHNYNNSMFFSSLPSLVNDDIIYIYDNSGKRYTYSVIDFYEVDEDDLSPIFNYEKNSKQLTLVTCNNLNSKRFIVKSIQK